VDLGGCRPRPSLGVGFRRKYVKIFILKAAHFVGFTVTKWAILIWLGVRFDCHMGQLATATLDSFQKVHAVLLDNLPGPVDVEHYFVFTLYLVEIEAIGGQVYFGLGVVWAGRQGGIDPIKDGAMDTVPGGLDQPVRIGRQHPRLRVLAPYFAVKLERRRF